MFTSASPTPAHLNDPKSGFIVCVRNQSVSVLEKCQTFDAPLHALKHGTLLAHGLPDLRTLAALLDALGRGQWLAVLGWPARPSGCLAHAASCFLLLQRYSAVRNHRWRRCLQEVDRGQHLSKKTPNFPQMGDTQTAKQLVALGGSAATWPTRVGRAVLKNWTNPNSY